MALATVASRSPVKHTISPPKTIEDGDENYYDRKKRTNSPPIKHNNHKNGFHKKTPTQTIVRENRGLALLAALAINKQKNLDYLYNSQIDVKNEATIESSSDSNLAIIKNDVEIDTRQEEIRTSTQASDNNISISKNFSDINISTKVITGIGNSQNGKTTCSTKLLKSKSVIETLLDSDEADTANGIAAGLSMKKLTKINKKSSSVSPVLTVLSSSKTTNSTTTIASNATTITPAVATVTTATKTTPTTKLISIRKSFLIPSDILDDLASRFIINIPDIEELNLIRIIFQIELAHWFYLDFFCTAEMNIEKKLKPIGIKLFTMQLFEHIPFLSQHLSSLDDILGEWKNYKQSVPTYGAILVADDLEHCLLVQSYISKSSWGFPKGKINENEDPVHCAAREVYEETGYDITKLIVPNEYIEAIINYQYIRLYIVRDIPIDTKFQPRTRNEIKSCDWFSIDSLPISKNDAISKTKLGLNSNAFFMILPFVKRLQKWVHDKRAGIETTTITTSTRRRRKNSGGNKNFTITGGGLGAAAVAAATATLTTATTKRTSPLTIANKIASQIKRQRHKSMGDLDGIKLNNIKINGMDNTNDPKICTVIPVTPVATITSISETSTAPAICKRQNKMNGINGGSGSNATGINGNSTTTSSSTSKRQLFLHNNGQINNMQHSEKILNTFDIIRKEKLLQQSIQTVTSIEKPLQAQNQQNGVINGGIGIATPIDIGIHKRVRAKSQSDKVVMQTIKSSTSSTLSSSSSSSSSYNNNNGKQRLQKQLSMIATISTNDLTTSIQIPIKAKTPPPILQRRQNDDNLKTLTTTDIDKTTNQLPIQKQSYTSAELIAIVAAASAKQQQQQQKQQQPQQQQQQQQNPQPQQQQLLLPNLNEPEKKTIILQQILSKSAPNSVQKLRPPTTAVALHIETTRTTTATAAPILQKLQRVVATQSSSTTSTNLSIVQTTDGQQQQQQHQHQTQHQPTLKIPSFNSWTNFSFTKNFITNVFC